MDASRVGTGEIVAGASGLGLLTVLFLPWYGVDVSVAGFVTTSKGLNAWEAFRLIDALLFLVAVVAVCVPLARAAGWLPTDAASAVLVCAGGLGVLLVLYRLIDLPGPGADPIAGDTIDFGRRLGLVLGLMATAGIAYGGRGRRLRRAHYESGLATPGDSTAMK